MICNTCKKEIKKGGYSIPVYGILKMNLCDDCMFDSIKDEFLIKDDIKPFKTDGCSLISPLWKLLHKFKLVNFEKLPFHSYCVEHDKAYWKGGTAKERFYYDCLLMAKVAKGGRPIVAFIMYLAVRIGGVPWLPFPWRWGFGYGYKEKMFYGKSV